MRSFFFLRSGVEYRILNNNNNNDDDNNNNNINTVKPLNSGHLRVSKYLSVIERCPLLGGNVWDVTFCPLFMACPLFGMSSVGRFH